MAFSITRRSESVLDLARILRRDALLARFASSPPEIAVLVAPAGFGKSTLARQIVEGHERSAVCDCAGPLGEVEFARRLIFALADEDPERATALSQVELLMGDGTMSVAERVELAVAAWSEPARPAAFVFEDLEHDALSPGALDLLARLLRKRPPGRSLVICSRGGLRLSLTRFAQPHRITTLRAEDLAFTRRELDELFAPLGLSDAVLDRVHAVSQGWPVPVLFLARVALEGRHEAALAQLGDVAFEELYEYLAEQVLAALAPDVRDALFAAACIPGAGARDLAFATGDAKAGETLERLARSSPVVRLDDDGEFVVHPFVRGMLTEHARAARDALLAETARAFAADGEYLRAAELHLARPDQEEAARALEREPVGDYRTPPMRYARLVAMLDRSIVRRYPTLWCCSALLQTFSVESDVLLGETGLLWASLAPDTPMYKRYYVLATRALMYTYLGRFDEALAVIDMAAPPESIPEVPASREHGYALYLRGTVYGRQGRIAEAEHDLRRAFPLIESMDAMASAALVIMATEVERVRGNVAREREMLARSLAYARNSEMSNFVSFRLAELAITNWLDGDDAGFAENVERLETLVERDGIRGFRFFVGALRGRDPEPAPPDLIRWIIWGHLVAAGGAADETAALRNARLARESARRYPNPYLQSLASLAAGLLAAGEESVAALADARAFAERSGAPAFAAAVAAAASGGEPAAMLRPFVRRLRERRPRARAPRLAVSVLAGTVHANGEAVKLGGRELELVLALARRPRPTTRDEVSAALWPAADDVSGAGNLKVLLHRARQRLGDDALIVRTSDGGLRLCDDASVDLWEIERAVNDLRSRDIRSDADAAAARAVYDRLRAPRPLKTATWEWFERVERHLRELESELGQSLAAYALARGRHADALALALAREMIAYDPCDEAACAIAIRGALAANDRSEALRLLRRHAEAMRTELACEPSPAITALLDD